MKDFRTKPNRTGYQIDVPPGGDPMRAYKRLKNMLKKDGVLEDYKERQSYQKPSFKRRERKKKRDRIINQLTRYAEAERGMGFPKR